MHLYLGFATILSLVIPLIAYNGCFVADLPNVIIQNEDGSILRSGERIANGTTVHFECRARHWLIGLSENYCQNGHWQDDFPFCQPYHQYIFTRLLIVFALVLTVVICTIYGARQVASGWQRQKVLMAEPNETPLSSMTTLNTSQV